MRHVLLLRGINLGRARRIAMADLRARLGEAGYDDVRTYLQSGNVVLSSPLRSARLEREAAALISDRFGFEVPVIARSETQLAQVVKLNPLGEAVADPKRYQVSFLAERPAPGVLKSLQELALPSERLAAHGRELYAWHPEGVARSKLALALGGKGLGVTATARNWTTVTMLLEMVAG